ncbi:MAG: GTP 3',8-cyclase MoaA [Myxococcota bacterium]
MSRALPVVESRMAVYGDLPARPVGWGGEALPGLEDTQGRQVTYLRLSVTDRCDLGCVYCMPPGGEIEHTVRRELLSFEEATRLVGVLRAMGVRRVRLTGGEPLVRKDVVRLVEQMHASAPELELAMTTNATRLADLAAPLWNAGLRGINVSLDTLQSARFKAMTRGGDLGRVLAGIHAARELGFRIKINIVAVRGHNDDEVGELVDWAWALGFVPRFIELMPLGEGAHLGLRARMGADEVAARLGDRLGGDAPKDDAVRGPATYRQAADGSGRRVGFITPLSHEFCGSCNRLRVTARGDVRACLASRQAVSLRDVMRASTEDRDVAWAAWWALSGKEEGHRFLDPSELEHENVGMSLIGG